MASFHNPFCATEMPNSTCSLASERASAYATPVSEISNSAAVNNRLRMVNTRLRMVNTRLRRRDVSTIHEPKRVGCFFARDPPTILLRLGTGLFPKEYPDGPQRGSPHPA